MANVNKVIYGNETLIDLTADTVTAETLAEGVTAHDKSGEIITGTRTFDTDTSDATATAAEILEGKTAYARGVLLTGTMVNNGSVEGTIESIDDAYSIPVGYHDGGGTVTIDSNEAAKLIPENILDGVEILGVTGTLSLDDDITIQTNKDVTPSTEEQTVVPDEGYNYLAQVTVAAIPYAETENAAGGITVTIAS